MSLQQDTYPLMDSNRIHDQFHTSNWMVGTMVTLFRQYFGSPERLSLEKARLLWSPDPATTQVQIDCVDNLQFDAAAKYPKILVDIEDQNFPRDVIGDVENYEPETGTVNFFNRRTGAFSIECWGFKKLEASSIADEILYFLQAYRAPISQKYEFRTLRVQQIIKPVRYRQFDQYWIGRLIVAFEMDERWGTGVEALKATRFATQFNFQ